MTGPARPLVVSMWSGPRNISTAMMYSFAQRPDAEVVDEPLYAHYLTVTGLDHPGRDDVIASQSADPDTVVADVILAPSERSVRFIKHMAHHLVAMDTGFLDETVNVFLTRTPAEMLLSLSKVLPDFVIGETGLPSQVAILDRIESGGGTPVVVDGRDVLADPAGVLGRLCAAIGIRFDEAMLSWPAGGRPEDGVWAPHWYAAVHRSTGFGSPPPPLDESTFPDHLRPLLAEAQPLYDRLRRYAI